MRVGLVLLRDAKQVECDNSDPLNLQRLIANELSTSKTKNVLNDESVRCDQPIFAAYSSKFVFSSL